MHWSSASIRRATIDKLMDTRIKVISDVFPKSVCGTERMAGDFQNGCRRRKGGFNQIDRGVKIGPGSIGHTSPLKKFNATGPSNLRLLHALVKQKSTKSSYIWNSPHISPHNITFLRTYPPTIFNRKYLIESTAE